MLLSLVAVSGVGGVGAWWLVVGGGGGAMGAGLYSSMERSDFLIYPNFLIT